MLFGALAFALMSTLIHGLSTTCDWQVIAIARTFLALTFAAGLATASGASLVFFRPRVIWIRSIAGSLALMTGFYSFTRLPVADVLTLTNMFPIWVAVLSWPILGVKPRRPTWLAVLAGVGGVVLIQQGNRLSIPTGEGDGLLRGNTWLVAALSSVCSAVALLGLNRLHRVDARAVVAHFSFVSLLFSIGSFFVFPATKPLQFSGPTVLMLLGVGITGTIGQIFLTKAFAAGDPSRVSVVGLSQVGFGALLEMIFFDRSFHGLTLLGMGLIVVPSAWLLLHRTHLDLPDSQLN